MRTTILLTRPFALVANKALVSARNVITMTRTIVYDKSTALSVEETRRPADGYMGKLTKYVPAEVLAFYMPTYQLVPVIVDDETGAALYDGWRIFVYGASLAGVLIYAYGRARIEQRTLKWYYYILALVAFSAWSLAISDVGERYLALPDFAASVILSISVFLVPGIDEYVMPTLDSWLRRTPLFRSKRG